MNDQDPGTENATLGILRAVTTQLDAAVAVLRAVTAQRDAALERVRELEAMRAAFLESAVAARVAAVLAERGIRD